MKDIWFSSLYSSAASRRGENQQNEMTFQVEKESERIKGRLQATMSLCVSIEEPFSEKSMETQEPLTSSVRPYVRKVNGHEFHCIDNEWK